MTLRKSVLCLVPLPPPITGASLASETVVNHLRKNHDVAVLDYQSGTLVSGKFSLRQAFRILLNGCRLIRLRLLQRFDHAYLVISSSFWGNLRDLFFMTVMGRCLRKNLVVHLHVANFDRYLREAPAWGRFLNRVLFKDVKAAIVLGETFQGVFDGYIKRDRVRIVENYFDPCLLIPEADLQQKFTSTGEVHFLFLSNLIKEKGYEKLLDAFLSLDEEMSGRAVLHFAGAIHSPPEKEAFLKRIENNPNIFYHGPLHGEDKKRLLWNSHVFWLPTLYVYEGQPISILEAYAAGSIVITTDHGGIKDIFTEGRNGYYVNKDADICTKDLRNYMEMVIADKRNYKKMAEYNRAEAVEKYQQQTFNQKIENVVLGN